MTEAESPPSPMRSSRLAQIALALAAAGLISAVTGVAGAQIGLLPPMLAFALCFFLGAIAAITATLLGLIAIITTRGGKDPTGAGRARIAVVVGLVMIATVFVAASPGQGLPSINDITTDVDDPPAFADASAVPAYRDRDMRYPAEFGPLVEKYYPDLDTVELRGTVESVHARAVEAAKSLGWEIVHADPAKGVFDATETSGLFKFVDDVTVRIRPGGAGVQVDVRSKSRDGRGDLGANAARIRRFVEALGA